MNLRHASIAVAAFLLAATAHSHDCSGGADGGMDATGNQCNDPASVVAVIPAPAVATPVAQIPRGVTAAGLADGLAAYERGHDAQAIAYFRRAAEAGDARSAEILALMYRFGPRLFHAGVPADPAEAAKWAAVAAEARRREVAARTAAR